MVDLNSVKDHIRNPLAWAADCEAQLGFDIEPEAKAAFRQLAAEFQATALEIEGLVSAFEAVIKRKPSRHLDARQLLRETSYAPKSPGPMDHAITQVMDTPDMPRSNNPG